MGRQGECVSCTLPAGVAARQVTPTALLPLPPLPLLQMVVMGDSLWLPFPFSDIFLQPPFALHSYFLTGTALWLRISIVVKVGALAPADREAASGWGRGQVG